jgi:hypothetical protein
MTLSAAPGSNERAMRSASIVAARTPVAAPVPAIEGAHLGRLVRRLDTGDAGSTGLLLVVGLLLGLILISAGCGPPS